MRLNRLPGAASKAEPARGRRAGAGVVRALSVTAAAAAVCAMGALPAMASSAHTTKLSSRTIVSAPKTAYTHTEVKLSVHVKGRGRTATGSVTFWLGTKKLCRATLSNSNGSCDYKFANPATKTITGKYSGDSRHTASSGTATIKVTNKPATGKFATTTTLNNPPLNAPVTAQAGTEVTLQATVTSSGGGVPTGTVTFVPTNLGPPPFATNITCSAALVAGVAKCDVDPPVGTWGFILYQAQYSGDATHAASETVAGAEYKLITPDPTSTTVEGPATAAAGSVTITADVVPNTYGGPTYNILAGYSETGGDLVQFTVNGAVACAASALQWNATTDVNYATCADTLGAGTYNVVATYSGDEYTNASTSEAFTLTVS
jgi:Bacterial Ig-like domain (group 3)